MNFTMIYFAVIGSIIEIQKIPVFLGGHIEQRKLFTS